ncbi:MAG: hypothetical protein ACRC1P_10910 [Cellulosilyticaceae bacterium]
MGNKLPCNLPFNLGGGGSKGLTLPFRLPGKLGGSSGSGGLKLPFKLPGKLGGNVVQRKSIKLPVVEECIYANETKKVKLPIVETTSIGHIKLPIVEQSWVFYGLVIEENIVRQISNPIVLSEDIKARIIADYEMINGSELKISWYGDRVDRVEIYVKMSLDEEYNKVGSYLWEQNSAVITLGNGEFDILLKGEGETGLSNVKTLGEPTFIEVDIVPEIPENEKIFDIEVKYTSEIQININY